MSKEKFNAYVKIQKSGKTNMWNVNRVIGLSKGILDKKDCLDIMKNYVKYWKKYG